MPENLAMTFEPFINYESIVSIRYKDSNDINSACMGVHFTPTDEVYLHAYSETDTRRLLTPGAVFVINFSEDFYEYVLAALKGNGDSTDRSELPDACYQDPEGHPVLKASWVSVVCEVISIPESSLKKPFCRRREAPNIRAKILAIRVKSFPKIFNNRSMNLALEALIITTRLPFYEKFSPVYKENLGLYLNIKKKLNDWRDMDRFHDGFEVMDNYLINHGLKPQELFNFH